MKRLLICLVLSVLITNPILATNLFDETSEDEAKLHGSVPGTPRRQMLKTLSGRDLPEDSVSARLGQLATDLSTHPSARSVVSTLKDELDLYRWKKVGAPSHIAALRFLVDRDEKLSAYELERHFTFMDFLYLQRYISPGIRPLLLSLLKQTQDVVAHNVLSALTKTTLAEEAGETALKIGSADKLSRLSILYVTPLAGGVPFKSLSLDFMLGAPVPTALFSHPTLEALEITGLNFFNLQEEAPSPEESSGRLRSLMLSRSIFPQDPSKVKAFFTFFPNLRNLALFSTFLGPFQRFLEKNPSFGERLASFSTDGFCNIQEKKKHRAFDVLKFLPKLRVFGLWKGNLEHFVTALEENSDVTKAITQNRTNLFIAGNCTATLFNPKSDDLQRTPLYRLVALFTGRETPITFHVGLRLLPQNDWGPFETACKKAGITLQKKFVAGKSQ